MHVFGIVGCHQDALLVKDTFPFWRVPSGRLPSWRFILLQGTFLEVILQESTILEDTLLEGILLDGTLLEDTLQVASLPALRWTAPWRTTSRNWKTVSRRRAPACADTLLEGTLLEETFV